MPQAQVEALAGNAQESGGFGLAAAGFHQGGAQQTGLELLHGRVKIGQHFLRRSIWCGWKPRVQADHQSFCKVARFPDIARPVMPGNRSEEHTSELQSRENLVCRLLLEKKKKTS